MNSETWVVNESLNESEDLALPGRAQDQASGSASDWAGPGGIGSEANRPPDHNAVGVVAARVLTDKAHMAGFFIRGMAFFVDLAILNVLFLILVLVGNLAMKIGLKSLYLESSSDELMRFLLGTYPAVWFFLFFTYFTFFMAYGGQTPGKILFRMRVLTKDLQPLTWRQAFLRTIGYFISSFLLLGLGFVVMIFHPQKRAIHDLIAGTTVLKGTSHS